MNTQPILNCHGLSKRYGSFYALSDLNLTLESGQIVGLLGPNGSGKTTLIKLINGLLTPSAGRVTINQMTPSAETKKIISYLPERSCLNPQMRVREILKFFTDFYADFQPESAAQMLRDMNIDQNRRLRTLSKGDKEKVQLILVMSRRAQLYILDEPIGGVDPAARDYILRTILSNYSENATILLSTHLISDIENILDRVLLMQSGRIVLNESVDEIRTTRGKSVDNLFREVFKC